MNEHAFGEFLSKLSNISMRARGSTKHKYDLWQPDTSEGYAIKLMVKFAIKAALIYEGKQRPQEELEELEELVEIGFDHSHIYAVMTRAVLIRREAVTALKRHEGDMVRAILELTSRDR